MYRKNCTWVYELKNDGFRAIAYMGHNSCRLIRICGAAAVDLTSTSQL